MIKKLFLNLILIFTIGLINAQNSLWTKTTETRLEALQKFDRTSTPDDADFYMLNFEAMKTALQTAPIRDFSGTVSSTIVSFPNASGALEQFSIYESSVMAPELAAKYTDIQSYVGQGIANPSAKIYLTTTVFGLHAMVLSDNGTYYIDPFTTNLKGYIVYDKKSLTTTKTFTCLNTDKQTTEESQFETNSTLIGDGIFRTYRMAMACTIEYAAYHVNAAVNAGTIPSGATLAQKKAVVLAAMNVTVSRLNSVYENDMSLRMQLVANNDLVIFITSDSFNNTDAETLISQSQTVIDQVIGYNNYDIGHTVSTGGGGLAALGSVCTSSKASGITGSNAPVGDPFDIDYVAHEVGHQFGASHTFNNSCGGNRSAAQAVEPGSGSTIMAYAGICPSNVQSNSDAYFHAVSIAQMSNHVTGTGNCAASIENNNTAPVIQSLSNYTIPKGTAFVLTGVATDNGTTPLTYCWEQTNPGQTTALPSATSTTSVPNFRSLTPSLAPKRYFPSLDNVLAGNLVPTWEVIPNVARTMNFALTVRDNSVSNGGQTSRQNTTITFDGTAGPFSISSQNSFVSYPAGSNQTVTWNVAATNQMPVNTKFVDIYLSTNNGNTFPILLASQVPNDGSEVITIPNLPGSTNRIMVKGYENIFFDVSNAAFSIVAPSNTFAIAFSGIEGGQNKSVCKGGSLTYTLPYSTYGGFASSTSFSVTNLPTGITANFAPATAIANTNVVLTLSTTNATLPQLYTIKVQAVSGAVTKNVNVYVSVLNNDFSPVVLTSPSNAAVIAPSEVNFTWTASTGATAYEIQIANDANFTTIIESATVQTNSYTSTALESLKTYFWRIQPKNESCSAAFSNSWTFSTIFCGLAQSVNIPVTIPDQIATVTSTITIDALNSVTIADVNVQLNISHSYVSDLNVKLTSPNGTQVVLVNNQCGSNNDINATFDDSGIPLVCGNGPAISGTLIPAQALSAFNGQTTQGVWTLTVADSFNSDGGAINNWSINFCSTAAPLEVLKNEFSDLMVYPNPNSGNFNVQFNNASSEKVEIKVYDMSARVIFTKNYAVQGDFNENIQLNTVQTGVYLMSIFDGERTQVQRIIIK